MYHDAGLPPGVLNIITCRPSDTPRIVNVMIEHPMVKKVNFTGSANMGRKIAQICGQNLKPCLMELGGKNSAIVLPDADLEKASRECVAGSFLNVSYQFARDSSSPYLLSWRVLLSYSLSRLHLF